MKKTLDTGSILNELQEGSAFFRGNTSTPARATEPKQPTTDRATSKAPATKSTKETQNRTVERNDRTDTPTGSPDTASSTSAVLTAIDDPQPTNKRRTERYSFEIYTDQKETIDDAKYLYYKKTGRKVSSSELMRDALDLFLARLMEKLED
jgi:hypothetical protein